MTPQAVGAGVGLVGGVGLMLALHRLLVMRRTPLTVRVLPYVRDLRHDRPISGAAPTGAVGALLLGPALARAARIVEQVLGGSASVQRRLDRADLEQTVQEFRVSQVVWGLLSFAVAAAWSLVRAFSEPGGMPTSLVLCACALVGGVVARDQWLTSRATSRERQMLAEFPIVAEFLALAVAAGESPVSALDRVVRRCSGALSTELNRVLGAVRTGTSVSVAFQEMGERTGVPVIARFAQGIAVAMDRGTPLADVLHAQAADVREAGRRALIETGARRETYMLVPVVFLVLPVTVLFAFYPGVIGLRLVTP